MNASFRLLISVTALSLPVAALPAVAADYDPPIMVDPVEEVPVEVGSGWYLRGDIGYNFSVEADGTFDYLTIDPITGVYSPNSFETGSLDENLTYGIGFGYHFTDMIRADFTFDGYKSDFDGTTSSPLPCVDPAVFPAFAGTGCRTEDGATASVLNFMINGYVDLGTYVGLTPYVGGGLGYSYVDWGSLSESTFCTGATCPQAFLGSGEVEGETSWRFAYAFMAGLAYDITNNMKVDLGYRYRAIDGGPMFVFNPATGATGTQGEDPGFTTHEVRLGVRYDLW